MLGGWSEIQGAMRMPKDVELRNTEVGPEVVRFTTRCGSVSGTAYRASGLYETHYEVVRAERLARPGLDDKSISPQMVQRVGTVGEFDVVGEVTFFFEDGVFIVEVHGFDFCVAPGQLDEPVSLGDWIDLHIRRFTLYV